MNLYHNACCKKAEKTFLKILLRKFIMYVTLEIILYLLYGKIYVVTIMNVHMRFDIVTIDIYTYVLL